MRPGLSTPTLSVSFGGLCTAMLAVACGGSTVGSLPDVAPTADAGADDAPVVDVSVPVEAAPEASVPDVVSVPYPAPHSPMPIVTNLGGPVMLTPKIVPITFPKDPFQDDIVQFVSGLGATAYWAAATSEYKVNAAVGQTPVILTESAPGTIDDTAIQTWITQSVASQVLPTPDAQTIFAIYYPAGTTVTLQGMSSCSAFGGYHNSVQLSSGPVSYAVIPRCASFGGMTGIDVITGTSSHELIEASTDPFPQTTNPGPAYGQVDLDHIVWEFVVGGGEVGDMCAQNPGAFFKPQGYAYTVQRTWSNKAAAASHDPCTPSLPNEVYFNSAPVLSDSVTLSIQGQSVTTKGVSIPVGQSKTVEVDLYSDGPTTGPWSLEAQDFGALQGGAADLSFQFDKTTGQNGDKVKMTITVMKQGQFGVEGFLLLNRLGSAGSFWIGLVGN
jgi:hypothetical protein